MGAEQKWNWKPEEAMELLRIACIDLGKDIWNGHALDRQLTVHERDGVLIACMGSLGRDEAGLCGYMCSIAAFRASELRHLGPADFVQLIVTRIVDSRPHHVEMGTDIWDDAAIEANLAIQVPAKRPRS